MTYDLALNPTLNARKLAKIYAENGGWIRINNLFSPDVADKIEHVLSEQTPWRLVHSDAQGHHQYYTQTQLAAIEPQARQKMFGDVMLRARDGFAYAYNVYPMVDAYLTGEDPDWPLHPMTEFLNSGEFQAFVKTVTNEPNVVKIDGQATCYARGHFLNTHDDTGHHQERAVAYVMGFSRDWRTEWGGQLLFTDDQGNAVRGFNPSFNSITLFKVPIPHIVTQVSTYAGASRYSITGWLRTDA